MTAAVAAADRFTRAHPCPICIGNSATARGKAVRCDGYSTPDGAAAFCARVSSEKPVGHLYRHWRFGRCDCGDTHRPWADAPPEIRERRGSAGVHAIDRTRSAPRSEAPDSPKPWRVPTDDVETFHPYKDPDTGELLFELARFAEHARDRYGAKVMPRHRVDGIWYWGAGELAGHADRVPLYRQREAVAELQQGGTTYVAGGEKDCDRIWSAEGVACCNAWGEGVGKFRAAHARTLAEALLAGDPHARLVIVADRDDTGVAHAGDVLAQLLAAGAPRDRIATMLPASGYHDPADHLDAGLGLGDFEPFEPAKSQDPPEDETDDLLARFEQSGIDDWFGEGGTIIEPPPRGYLVEDFIPALIAMLLIARGGTGKGNFEVTLAISLALALHFGPFRVCKPRGVVIVSREDDRAELQRRFAAALRARFPGGLTADQREQLVDNIRVVDLFGVRGARLDDALVRATAAQTQTMAAPGIVILDPLGKLLPREEGQPFSLNSQEGAGLVHEWLDVLVRETGCGVLMAHHTNKTAIRSGDLERGGASTGSQLLEDLARFVLGLQLVRREDAKKLGLPTQSRYGYVQAVPVKQNYAPPMTDPLVFERVAGGALVSVTAVRPSDVLDERVLQLLVQSVADTGRGLDRDAWRKACADADPPISKHDADVSRARLKERGLAIDEPAEPRSRRMLWRLSDTASLRVRPFNDEGIA